MIRREAFAVTDVEAPGWSNFKCAGWVTSQGERVVFERREDWVGHMRRFKGRVFAHYGGRFDWFHADRPSRLTLSGGGISRAQLGQATLLDCWELFQAPLAEVGEWVGILKPPGVSERMAELSLAEASAHALNDCDIALAALKAHRDWFASLKHPDGHWPTTAGGTAIGAFEVLEPEVVRRLERQTLDVDEWMDHWQAASGARTEVFQLGLVNGPIYVYDVRSSYPAGWAEGPLPLGPWTAVDTEVARRPGVYLCEVRQSAKDGQYPLVAPSESWRYTGEVWCTSEEVAAIREAGGTVRVLRGWVAPRVYWAGATFVSTMYAQRLAGVPWGKVSLNALTGKTLQGLLGTAYTLERDGCYWQDEEATLPSWFQRPLLGGWVHARARLRLWRVMEALRRAGWRVWYVDTDCVHTDCPPELFPAVLSEECGAWRLEYMAESAVYVAPKCYGLRWPGGERLVCKGVPREAVTWERLESAAKGERVPVSVIQGLDSFLALGSDWGPHPAEVRRTINRHTGGKAFEPGHGNTGRLHYRDRKQAR